MTSLETKIVWESRSKTFYPLTLKGKPRKTHFLALGENLVLVWEIVDAKHNQLKLWEENNLAACEKGVQKVFCHATKGKEAC